MSEAEKVRQLSFSDLYLGHPSLGDCFTDVHGGEVSPLPRTIDLRRDLVGLLDACRKAESGSARSVGGAKSSEFKLNYDNVAYRVSVMRTFGGSMFVLRKIADTISSLGDLGIPQAYIRCLMAKELTGLFVVSGSINSGKTTTACALIKERLTTFGGVAVTAESPIELPLEGRHGRGVCYQTTISHNSRSFVENFRHVLHWGARIIYVDDIRDSDVAAELLQASVNDHLIVCTMLAENVIQTINKLYALAEERLTSESARTLLADGLVGVLHQRRSRTMSGKLESEFLSLRDTAAIKNILRNGQYELLAPSIKQQMASMIAENAMAQRYPGA